MDKIQFKGYLYSLDMQEHQEQVHQQINQSTPIQKLKAAINIAETMPPSKIRKNLIGLINLAPQIQDNLMEKIDLPLQIDESVPNQPFLKAQFNRDGDSYRSCITNQYYPPAEGYLPSAQFRRLQQIGNVLFTQYTKLYYGNGGISSFYIAQGSDANNFSLGFFAKKDCSEENKIEFLGSWNSFNIADVHISGQQATIKLNTTILIEMNIQNESHGVVDLNGFLKKTKTQKRKLGKQKLQDVIVGFGELVEDLETIMRQHLQAIYIGKTREITFSTRYEYTIEFQKQRRSLAKGLRQIHLGQA